MMIKSVIAYFKYAMKHSCSCSSVQLYLSASDLGLEILSHWANIAQNFRGMLFAAPVQFKTKIQESIFYIIKHK